MAFLSKMTEIERETIKGQKASLFSRVSALFLRGLLTLLSPIVWMLSYLLDMQTRRKKARMVNGDDWISESARSEAILAFKDADVDGNGVLSFDEFRAAFGNTLSNTTVTTVWKEFQDMDINNDGEISVEEFTAKPRSWLTPKSTDAKN